MYFIYFLFCAYITQIYEPSFSSEIEEHLKSRKPPHTKKKLQIILDFDMYKYFLNRHALKWTIWKNL